MVGAGLYKISDCKGLTLEEMDFIIHHHKQYEDSRILSLGKMLGTTFSVAEIRSWNQKNTGPVKRYKDSENIIIPLSMVIKGDIQEGLKKMVSNSLQTSEQYSAQEGEKVISLGQVTPEEFQYFLKHKKLPESTLRSFMDEG